MNVNEVIANRAEELLGGRRGEYRIVHPNDSVNRSQSTNDVYPTATAIATIRTGAEALSAFVHLRATFEEKADETAALTRIGRTCLRDAVPLPAGMRHAADAAALGRTTSDLDAALNSLLPVPLGATAVGTGLGAPAGYRDLVVAHLAAETTLPLVPAPDPYDALAHFDPYVAVSAALVRVMLVLGQAANDFRFLSSGPTGGVGELRLPPVQVGSSIMPGKLNPVIPELVLQVGFEIRGAAHTIELAVAAGELELNVMEPVIARHMLASLREAGRVARVFADRCVAGLAWDADRVAANLAGSRAELVALAEAEGYEAAARRAGLPPG
jgi:aspartate ammonia-lyase